MGMLKQVIRTEQRPDRRTFLLVIFSPSKTPYLAAHSKALRTSTEHWCNPVVSTVFTDMSLCCTVNPKQVLFLSKDT